jgi:hypothetical protein
MLDRFNMLDCNATKLPATADQQLTKADCPTTDEGKLEMASKPYRSLVGCLSYISYVTRLDVSNAVRALSSFSNNPGEPHGTAAKRCLRYLSGYPELGIVYKSAARLGGAPLELVGYCDASWGDHPDSARSTTGFVFVLAGGPVAYASRLQKSTARSTMEAEYMALFEGAETCEQLRDLLKHVGEQQRGPTALYEDNAASIAIANANGCPSKAARHIKIRYHYVRELVQDRIISELQLADGLTKNLPQARLEELRAKLMG